MTRTEIIVGILLLCLPFSGLVNSAETRAKTISHAGEVNLGLAQSYFEINDMETALLRTNKVLASDPGSAEAHVMYAMILARTGQTELATQEFNRAVSLAPNSGVILNAHAVWMCQNGQADYADGEFVRALADPYYLTPKQALFNAGTCAHNAGKNSVAEQHLRQALLISPDDKGVLLLLAKVEFAQGKLMEARAFIQRCDANGSAPEVLELAAQIEDAAINPRAAAQYRQRLHNEFPDYAPIAKQVPTP